MISERTRDKIAATRRKGKWAGRDAAPGLRRRGPQAGRQRARGPAGPRDLRALCTKAVAVGGRPGAHGTGLDQQGLDHAEGHPARRRLLIKTSLHQLLTNATYTGKVRHKGDLFAGEHPGIVAEDLFDRVQGILHDGKNNASRSANGAATALLRGLARCAACDRAMSHSYASRGS